MILRLGSRGSRLALARPSWRRGPACRAPELEIALVPITTAGDRDRRKPFGEIGERGVFVKEIEEALLAGRIDVAVHSAKDMTSTDTAGLTVAAYLPREDPRDALCGASTLEPGMRIGTASVRRKAQLLAFDSSLRIEPLRGNVDSRLRKRGERGLDAIVLAAAGLDRLGLADEIGLRLEPELMLPEAGQGAVALQVRAGEEELVGAAGDAETRGRVEAERACVATIGGGCLAPIAAHHDGTELRALIAAEDGSWVERRTGSDPVALARGAARGDRGTRMKVALTRAAGGNDALAALLDRVRGRRVPAHRGRADLRRGDLARGLRLGRADEPSRGRCALRAARGAPARVAAIGPGTAEGLRAHGVEPDLVAEVSTQEGLVAAFPPEPGRVLFAGAEAARDVLARELGADFLPLYRTVELRPAAFPDADLVVLASASAARAFAALDRSIAVVSIGPSHLGGGA